MAGILAPTVGDIGTGGGGPVGQSSPAATALGGIGNILRIGSDVLRNTAKANEGVTLSAGEREDAALRPFIEQANRIKSLADSGNMDPRQITALTNRLKQGALVALPGSAGLINAAFDTIFQKDTSEPEFDPEEQAIQAQNDFYSKDPRGISLLPRTFVFDENDQLDVEATQKRGKAIALQFFAQDAQDAVLADDLARAKTTNDINDQTQRGLVDGFILQSVDEATSIISGLAGASDLASSNAGQEDLLIGLTLGLRDARNDFAARQAQRAASIGLTNAEGYDAQVALQIFDDKLASLEKIAEAPTILQNMIDAKGSNAVSKLYLSVTGMYPGRAGREFIEALMAEPHRGALMVAAAADLANRKAETTDIGVALPGDTNTTSKINPTFTQQAADLPSFKQVSETADSLDAFYLSEGYTGKDPVVRAQGVEFFTRAVGIMQATGKDIAESTFDKTYRPQFFKMFDDITSVADDITTKFADVVLENVRTTQDQVKTLTDFTISNEFASDYNTLSVRSDGSKFVLDLGVQKGLGLGQDSKEVVLTSLLAEQGLPLSMEGLERLINTPPSKIGLGAGNTQKITAIGDAKRMVRILKPKLNYLNKIVGVQDKLKATVLQRDPSNEFADTPTVAGVVESVAAEATPVAITTKKEYRALPMGTTFTWSDEDGIHTEVKGEN